MATKSKKPKLSEKEYECSAVVTGGIYSATVSATSKKEAMKEYLKEVKREGLEIDKDMIEIEEWDFNNF